ncbi:MAG: hypothetical protein LUD76_07650 [Alistipes sp.]|nr:hypothetical protein [Alistipes sp.]
MGEEPMLHTSNENTGTGVSVENSPLRGTNISPRRPITKPEKPESTFPDGKRDTELSLDSRLDFVTAPKVVVATVPETEPQEAEGDNYVAGAATGPSPAQPEIVKVIIIYSDGTFDSFGAK